MAKRWIHATTLILALAACTPSEPSPPVTALPVAAPVRLAVGSVEVASAAQYPANMNFIGRRRSETLAQDAQSFLREHVLAGGGADFARATVEEASIIERARATEGGILSTEPTWEMVGTLALKVAVIDGLGIEQSFASSRVEIKRSLSSRTGIEARDAISRALGNDLIATAGRELDQSIQQNLADRRLP